MSDKRKILLIEKALGFCLERGVSRQKGRLQVPQLLDLLDGIQRLKKRYVHLVPREIRSSEQLHDDVALLFRDQGPALWPSFPARDQCCWLIDAEKSSVKDTYYPRNLFFADEGDRRM